MRFLKIMVTVMGVMIIGGLIFMVYGISTGLHKSSEKKDHTKIDQQDIPLNEADIMSFGDHTVALENNQILLGHEVRGGRFILHIQNTDNFEQKWLIWNLRDGKQQGSITLKPFVKP